MLEENIWMQLSDDEKIAELQSYLDAIVEIDKGNHKLSKSREQGRIPLIKKQLHDTIFKIIDLENAL